MDAELPCRIRRRGNYAAFIRLSTHHHRFALQCRVEQLFDRNEERVHVEMEIRPHKKGTDHSVPNRQSFNRPQHIFSEQSGLSLFMRTYFLFPKLLYSY